MRRAVCLRPTCTPLSCRFLVLSRGARCAGTPPCKRLSPLYPRGPRSGPGYSVPVHQHLIGPIRPTRRHISISPTRLIRDALAVRLTSTPRRPASGSVLSLAILCRHVALKDPGKPIGCYYPVLHRSRWPSTIWEGLGTSIALHPPILVEESISWLNYGSLTLQPADLLAPFVGADQAFAQPTGTFTSGLSTDWSPAPPPDITTVVTGQVPLAGLAPARTPTSIAATQYWTSMSNDDSLIFMRRWQPE